MNKDQRSVKWGVTRRRFARAIQGVVLAGALAACGGGGGGGGDSTEGTGAVEIPTANYFPLAQGNSWQYRRTDRSGAVFDANMSIGAPRMEGGVQIWPLTGTSNDPDEGAYSIELVATASALTELASGLSELGVNLGNADILRYPMRQGESFVSLDKTVQIDLDGDGTLDAFTVREVATPVGVESVSVPAGVFASALHMRVAVTLRVQDGRSGQSQTEELVTHDWYAPNVGRVKSTLAFATSEGTPEQTDVLVSYRAGP